MGVQAKKKKKKKKKKKIAICHRELNTRVFG